MPVGFYADMVRETTATTGTGTITLAGAVAGYQSFNSAFTTGKVVTYRMSDGTNWEVGIGTFTSSGTTLSRTTVLSSSNAGALVNFPGASTDVACELPSETIADMGVTTAWSSRMVCS